MDKAKTGQEDQNITENDKADKAKSIRVRFRYEKRGGACFVPHVSLINLFARSALRAEIKLTMTEGFSPHPKISFGPELPAGVVALGELVDVYHDREQFGLGNGAYNITAGAWLDDCITRWNRALPEGFKILDATLPPMESPALGKVLQAAVYWVAPARSGSDNDTSDMIVTCEKLLASAREFYGSAVLGASIIEDDWVKLILAAPAQNGIGGWVKAMIAAGTISGWHEINIVRTEMRLKNAIER